MKLFKNLTTKLKSSDDVTDQSQEDVNHASNEESDPLKEIDPLSRRLLHAVHEMIEAKETLKCHLEERGEELTNMNQKLDEQEQEKLFLKKKIDYLNNELVKMQEHLKDQKMQYEQISHEFTNYKTKQENTIQGLQENIEERELRQRQLFVDLNRTQKEANRVIQELKDDKRELLVKYNYLEEKYNKEVAENQRLMGIIQEFASQASAMKQFGEYKLVTNTEKEENLMTK